MINHYSAVFLFMHYFLSVWQKTQPGNMAQNTAQKPKDERFLSAQKLSCKQSSAHRKGGKFSAIHAENSPPVYSFITSLIA